MTFEPPRGLSQLFALVVACLCLGHAQAGLAQPTSLPAATSLPTPTDPATLGASACHSATTVAGVVVSPTGSVPYGDLVSAARAVGDGDTLWVCPGIHSIDESLVFADRAGLALAGRDALIVAASDVVVARFERVSGLTVEGLGFAHSLAYGGCTSDVVEIVDSSNVTVTESRFDGSGIAGIELGGVTGASITHNLLTNCEIGVSVTDSTDVSLTGNRFVLNDAHVGGALDLASVAADNELGPTGRETAEPPPLSPAPTADAWVDWGALLASHTAYPIREWRGHHYVVSHFTWGQIDETPMPSCFGFAGPCTEPHPYPGDDGTFFRVEHGRSLQVVTPAGPCSPSVGDVVMLDTTGCEPSVTLARRIDGCGDVFAPVALAGPELPGLTWHPRDERRLDPGAGATADSELRAWLDATLADTVVGSWDTATSNNRGEAVSWRVELPHERLTTHLAGFQGALSECEVLERTWSQTTLQVGDARGALTLPAPMSWTPWTGVLALDGRVAAVVGQSQIAVVLVTRGADGRLEPALDLPYYRDNEECYDTEMPGHFAYPCGP